jgi:hypothetical protein
VLRPYLRMSLLILGAVCPGVAHAQGLVYRPTPDTLRYESFNSYLLYFVRGADTLGQPVATRTLESRYFAPAGPNLDVWVRLEGTGAFAFHSVQTYTVAPSGRLLLVAGKPVADAPTARVDLLPRLPSTGTGLSVGDRWQDSVSDGGAQPYGQVFYRVLRLYRVERLVDTVGAQLALLVSHGQMRLRQGGWQDSAAALVWWQEVQGPVIDSVWFDTSRGQIAASYTAMELTGSGGVGPIGGGERMPSGLRSSVRLANRR